MKVDLSLFLLIGSVIACGLILLVFQTGHDYYNYVTFWDYIMKYRVVDPNQPVAYGPLYPLIAPLYLLHYDLPRFFFLLIYCFGGYLLIKHLGLSSKFKLILWWLLWIWNPLLIIFGIFFGSIDVLLAGFMSISLMLFIQKKVVGSGIFLGLAISLKFVPLLILPIKSIALQSFISRARYILALIILIVACYVIAFLWVDFSALKPLSYGVHRSSKMLSIFRFLEGPYGPGINLNVLSTPLILLSASCGVWVSYLRKWPWEYALSTVYLLTLTFYNVGHHQYYIPFFAWMLFLYFRDYTRLSRFEITAFSVLYLWINMLAIGYILLDDFRNTYSWIRDFIGLPTFVFQIWLLIILISIMEAHKDQSLYLDKA